MARGTAPTLGTLLRRLIEALDSAVEEAYLREGLDYRPRYTPVIRVLVDQGPTSIRVLASQTGVTHSAVSQTVSEMARRGLVALTTGRDARERIVDLTTMGRGIVPRLETHWATTQRAVRSLDRELSMPLAALATEALAALDRRSFGERIAEASSRRVRRSNEEPA